MNKKTILITGGSEGLGKAIAAKLSTSHQVIILSHNLEKLQSVAKEISCDFVQADVSDYSSVSTAIDQVVAKYNHLDVLINNAGIWTEGPLEDIDVEKIKDVINVNALGTIFVTKAVLPVMKTIGSGRIINIVSQDGLVAKKDHTIYSASKWAITGFTKCLIEDLSSHNIGVTGIYPGMIKTSLFEKQGVKRDLSRAIDPSEIAGLVEYVINLSPETLIPEVGIKNINNPNHMDDNSAPQIGLDLNPDLITNSPSQTPTTNFSSLPPVPPGVIDITPGATTEEHPSKVEDITPRDNSTIPVITPQTAITAPVETLSANNVIDITPSESASTSTEIQSPVIPEEIRTDATHLADIATNSAPTAAPAPVTPADVVSTPVVEAAPAPVTPADVVSTPVVEAAPAPVTPAASEVVLTPTPDAPAEETKNPLFEDPDVVKIIK